MNGILARALQPRIRASQFSGATLGRLTADWVFQHLSADEEIRGDVRELRGRSRELVRNTSWATKYLRLCESNVIGPRGIRLQARTTDKRGNRDRDLNAEIEAAWTEWGRKGVPTLDGRLTWHDVQRRVMKTVPQDGEFFVNMIRGAENDFAFALQLIDADLLDETYNQARSERNNEIRMGIEFDLKSRPVQYHFWSAHPSDFFKGRERMPLPASQIIHLFDAHRVNGSRGLPWFSSVMWDLNMLRGYQEAELVAARLAAAKGGWFESDADAGIFPPDQTKKPIKMKAEPGVVDYLPPGVRFNAWNPEHPTTAYGEFVTNVLQSVAGGMGVSYTSLANDLSEVNFSSIRAGLLDERDSWRMQQQWLIDHLMWPVYREWVVMARLSGMLDPRVPLETYYEVEWQPRGWDWVDPLKDVQAAVLAIKNGLNSRQNVTAAQGRDLEDVYDDLQLEEELASERGLEFEEKTDTRGEEGPREAGARAEVIEALALQREGGGNGKR